MNSRDSDIVDPELAIMPPPYFDGLILTWENDVDCLFSNGFSRIGFHDEVGLIRFLVGEHFDISPVLEVHYVGE